MKPWEKYQSDTAASATGPWDKYGGAVGTTPAVSSPVAPLDRLPPDSPPVAIPRHSDSIAERLLGLGEAGLSVATGALAAPVGAAYGIGKTLTSGKYGTQQGIEEGDRAGAALASKLTYQPRTEAGRNDVDALSNSGLAHALQGMPVESPMIARIPEVPRGVLATGEGAAGAARAGANAVGRGARSVARGAVQGLPEVDPQTLQLARQAHTLGFRLRPDQIYGNRYGRYAGEMAQDNPFVASNRDFNQDMFNHQLVYLLGEDGNRLTRQVFNRAMTRSGETIGEIAGSHDVPFNEELVNRLAGHVTEAQRYQTGDVERVVRGYVDEITDRSQGGVLPGEAFRRINTRLNTQIRNTQNGDLRNALSGLQDDLQESFVAQLSPEDLNRYNTARRQYAVGKTLEPLVAKSPTGRIPPAALLGAVTRNQTGRSAMARGAAGDLGTLADIGQRFLKEQPSSGTAERTLMQNLLTHPLGTVAAGGTAALTAPAAAAYNRFGPEVTDLLIQRPPQ
ncbi:hypothetical protein [Burkholderia lata]|uniref:hypothetical protein n=1 Tax=Burkholderia lata (strain ATCC 17760 / DSM 23089 / LMG 22485 / NCIMB 9086 / R18194 / 383) TaxID=482957 RepID=UPI001453D301|nr:hypothetical protein [Burkholderia lata]VWB67144.1 hypothetical protein BLA15816_03179 [Burkholderia lata]